MTRTIIYFVESPVFGGAEQSLAQMLAQLDRRQWRPVLFHRPEPGLAPLLERAKRLEVATKAVPWLQGVRAPAQLLYLIDCLRSERPAVFHAHLQWPLAAQAGLLAAALARVPAILATVQLFYEMPWSRLILLQQRLATAGVHRYIAVSRSIADKLERVFHISPDKIRVIHNAIDPSQFERPCRPALRAALTGDASRPLVLGVARLEQQKGQTYLLEAIARIPEATLVLVGDGPDRAQLETQARELEICDRVRFLGYREDVADLLASCDVFVLPSLFEGLPLSVLEAMAAGKPVIATKIEGTTEAIVDGETGLLVPPRNSRALANAIHQLIQEPRLARRLAAAGRAHVRAEFNTEIQMASTIRIYEELLAARGRDGG